MSQQKAGATGPRSYFARVSEVLRLEGAAITEAASVLKPAEVEKALGILAACEGKVVVGGVGKSGIIAQKIAATLTSTGTAALYLHPSDALHGGLGIVAPGDVMLLLSNSGETDELVAMLPFLKRRGVPIIAIVGNDRSTLAGKADVALNAAVVQEACPLNLAPTTSTAVALAIGDALALTLMAIKGWTSDDFAMNHPAGRIGKRLTLKVADLMHGDGCNPMVKEDARWLDVIAAISRGGLGAVNVVSAEDHLLGLITDGDVRRALERIDHSELASIKCGVIMTRQPVVATPQMLAYDALQLMEDRPAQISVLPVVNEAGRCVGLLRLHDVVRAGL